MIFRGLLLILISVIFIACQKSETENTSLPLPEISPKVETTPDSAIRKIDFNNFSFPATEEYEKFTLKNGEKSFVMGKEDGISFGNIKYADVTSDNKEEAILELSIQTGGSSMPNLIFVYSLEKNKPKLLWSFVTGDRAEGGYKNVYEENGNLVVETFGDNKFENDKWKFDFPKDKFNGYCCPMAYTKIVFKWNGEKFVPFGKKQVFDYDWKKNLKSN